MYSPPHYRENNPAILKRIISKYNFATVITSTIDGPVISHLPFIFYGDSLLGHLALANPHWRCWEKNSEVTLVFNGPNGYISPDWYVPDPMNVPTWNYVAVHVKGKVRIEKDEARILEHMHSLTRSLEEQNKTSWSLPATGFEPLLKAIVVFTVEDLSMEGKLKLSQGQHPENLKRMVSELSEKNPELSLFIDQKF